MLAAAAISSAAAQFAPRAALGPGDPLPSEVLIDQAGSLGAELAPIIGKRPLFLAYWRPKDPASEQALVNAAQTVRLVAPDIVFAPLAVLAASQPPDEITARLRYLGLPDVPPRLDGGGRLATLLGIQRVPSFVLVDAGGVVRVVGGSDVSQAGADGVSIAEALALAGKGAAVPTLGVLSTQPVYRLLGRNVPDAAVTELDGKTFRKLSSYFGKGKRVVLFAWLPTCPHCKVALPRLHEWYIKNRPADLEIIDIARAEAPALQGDAAAVIRDYPWTHLLDVDRSALRSLLVTETPTVFLVDGAGVIQGIQMGGEINWEKWLGSGNAKPRAGTR